MGKSKYSVEDKEEFLRLRGEGFSNTEIKKNHSGWDERWMQRTYNAGIPVGSYYEQIRTDTNQYEPRGFLENVRKYEQIRTNTNRGSYFFARYEPVRTENFLESTNRYEPRR